jgi:hypothetical protein
LFFQARVSTCSAAIISSAESKEIKAWVPPIKQKPMSCLPLSMSPLSLCFCS